MAIDTAEKRYSMLNMIGPDTGSPHTLFEPDGAVDLDDRQHLLDCYSGIAFGGAPTVNLMNQIQFANLGADLYDGTLI